ncbi:multifunctional CCA protein [Planctomycetales bacterium]|nr:multifunctional CCA protein [Planctomycetales bacterium]
MKEIADLAKRVIIIDMFLNSFQPNQNARRIIEILRQNGAGDCLFVGGCVRDSLLGIVPKDYDIEVYGLTYRQIIKILRSHGFRTGLVGQSFGTLKVNNEIDVSIPRTESKSGTGHKEFDIASDPNLDPKTAFARRDFTINALGIRLNNGGYELVDYYGGADDLQNKILRAPTEAFCEDPLRVLRGMQFVARFGFGMETRTIELCRKVLPEFSTLSAERVYAEWTKWALKGQYPGKGLQLLADTGWIECFPEIAALVGVPQNSLYHPEGDAFVHTKLVCDAAAAIAGEMQLDDTERTILLFGALCHDFGKPSTTVFLDGRWRSPRHAQEGEPLASRFLRRLQAPNRIIETVPVLVREHLAHSAIPNDQVPSRAAVRRLSVRLEPANIKLWAAVCRADALGCGDGQPRYRVETWVEVAEKLNVRESKPKPILQGRDLIPLGFKPGPAMGKILNDGYEQQLDGKINSLDEAIHWVQETQQD